MAGGLAHLRQALCRMAEGLGNFAGIRWRLPATLFAPMRYLFRRVALALLLLPALVRAQAPATITLSGYVRDGATGENLIGATVVRPATRQGTATNPFGFYSLTLPASATDSADLVVTFLGYDPVRRRVSLSRSQALDWRPRPSARQLETAVVTGTRDAAEGRLSETTRMSTINVPIAQLKQVPALLGERDVLTGAPAAAGRAERRRGPDRPVRARRLARPEPDSARRHARV